MKQQSFKILLIYPPPNDKISPHEKQVLLGDIQNIPYGLLSLAAQAKSNGYDVDVLNLFTFPWDEIKDIIRNRRADLFGISCFTSNRRGALLMADLIRSVYPEAFIITGGPHPTALPAEMLENSASLDLVVTGEAEEALLEIIAKLKRGENPSGIKGTYWRKDGKPQSGDLRKPVKNLDSLANIFKYFNEYILITTRGCPYNCTFCGSSLMWSGRIRSHSAGAVVEMLDTIVNRNAQKLVAIKDETFTYKKDYVVEICEGILRKGLNFIWSCDTRADCLDEELLYMMRRSGCLRISFGVESASEKILNNLNKRTDLKKVRSTTLLAKKFGFQIRYYMIVGSRGETLETLKETLDFIEDVKPNQVVFNPFTVFPGTEEFEIAERKGLIKKQDFFSDDFLDFTPDAAEKDNQEIYQWMEKNSGLKRLWDYSVSELEETAKFFPEQSSVYVELAGAHYREGDRDKTEFFIQKALSLGYPLPGICYNYLACVAAGRRDYRQALEHLINAKKHGYHSVVEKNIETAKKWAAGAKQAFLLPLELEADSSFEVTRLKEQPMTPAKISRSSDCC